MGKGVGESASRIDNGWVMHAGGCQYAKAGSLWLIRPLDAGWPLVIDGPGGRVTLDPSEATYLLGASRNARIFIDSPYYWRSEAKEQTPLRKPL